MLTAEFRDIKVNVLQCNIGCNTVLDSSEGCGISSSCGKVPWKGGHFEWGLMEGEFQPGVEGKEHFSQHNKMLLVGPCWFQGECRESVVQTRSTWVGDHQDWLCGTCGWHRRDTDLDFLHRSPITETSVCGELANSSTGGSCSAKKRGWENLFICGAACWKYSGPT